MFNDHLGSNANVQDYFCCNVKKTQHLNPLALFLDQDLIFLVSIYMY